MELVRGAPEPAISICLAVDAINRKLILPMVLDNPELLAAEHAILGDEGWSEAVGLAQAMKDRVVQRNAGAIPNPKKSVAHTHLVGSQIVERRCERCGVWEAHTDGRFSRCAACKLVYYCGRECQKAHWREHKQACKQ